MHEAEDVDSLEFLWSELIEELEAQCCVWRKDAPIHISCRKKFRFEVENLLKSGVSINLQNGKGDSPLHIATAVNSFNFVQSFIRKGALINMKNKKGKTPLHAACKNSSPDVVKVLLKCGAFLNAKDRSNETPLHKTVFIEHSKSVEIINILLQQKCIDLDVKNVYGETPLHKFIKVASFDDSLKMVESLLEHGADLNIKNYKGETPLYLAIKHGYSGIKICQLFLKYGPKTDLKDRKGRTALQLAIYKKNYEVFKSLLEYGAHFEEGFQLFCDQTKRVFCEHIVKLLTANLPLSFAAFFDDIKNYYQHKIQCLEEFEKIKTAKVEERFTLSVLFIQRNNPYFFKDKGSIRSIERVLQSAELRQEFPLYCDILNSTFLKTRTRLFFILMGTEALNVLFAKSVPELVLKIIVKYLNNEDLENLTRAVSNQLSLSKDTKRLLKTLNGRFFSIKSNKSLQIILK